MKATTRIASTLVLLACATAAASAFAQNANPDQPAADASKMSKPGHDTGSAHKGTNKSDTLMQQREKGMAPDAASGGKSTGKMTQ